VHISPSTAALEASSSIRYVLCPGVCIHMGMSIVGTCVAVTAVRYSGVLFHELDMFYTNIVHTGMVYIALLCRYLYRVKTHACSACPEHRDVVW